MTRKEAITVLKGLSDNPLFSNQHKAAFNIAIHDIKQRHDWDINNLILINKDNYEPLEQEPKTGHWEYVQYDYNPKLGNWNCSECRCVVIECVSKEDEGGIPLYKYCPQCGAKMVEPQESEERA